MIADVKSDYSNRPITFSVPLNTPGLSQRIPEKRMRGVIVCEYFDTEDDRTYWVVLVEGHFHKVSIHGESWWFGHTD